MLNIGFRPAEEDPPSDDDVLDALVTDFADGWWALEKRSEVARGIEVGGGKMKETCLCHSLAVS